MLYGRQPETGKPTPDREDEDSPRREDAEESAGRELAAPAELDGHPDDPRPDSDPPTPDDPGTPDPDAEPPTTPDEEPGGEPDEAPDSNPDDPGESPEEDPPSEGDEPDPLSPRASGADGDPVFRRGGLSLGEVEESAPVSSEAPRLPVDPATRGVTDRELGSDRRFEDAPAASSEAAAAGDEPPSVGWEASAEAAEEAPPKGAAAEDLRTENFRPELETFSGPLELLLYLIHKDEVDIFDIPIARLLTQFLAHVQRLERAGRLDLQQTGEFLVMAARLMEIKSRMLLPDDAEDDEDLLEAEVEDPRWSLVKQLLEFREIKERAQLLEAAHRNRSQCFERLPGELPPPEPGSLDLRETSTLDLRAAFQRVLDLLRERDAVRVVPGEEIPIEVAMSGIREKLLARPERRQLFSEIFPRDLGLRGLISYFMALLELTRLRHLQLEQPDDYGDILVILREAA